MEQMCMLCLKLFNLEDGGFTVVRSLLRGKMLVLGPDGAAHELLSERRTQRKLRDQQKKSEPSVIVRLVNQVLENGGCTPPHTPISTTPEIPKPSKEPTTAPVTKKVYQLLGTVRSELNQGGFTIIEGDDGLEYLLRGDGIIPDINGLRFLRAGERVLFSPNQHFRKNIAKEVVPVSRATEPLFEPDFKDWYNLSVEIHDTDNGFAIGRLAGTDLEVFIPSRTVYRQSTYKQAFRDIKPGDVLAVRIKPSVEVANKFESIVAMLEDMPEEVEQSSRATLGNIYAQPGDEEGL
jgi:hypothetical protein